MLSSVFVCLFAGLRKNYSTHSHKIRRRGGHEPRVTLYDPYLSASDVVFHEEALYQVYVPLPLPLREKPFDFGGNPNHVTLGFGYRVRLGGN